MLHVTIDAFSGRQNPTCIIDGNEAKEIIKDLARNRSAVGEKDSGYSGLGFRGITIGATSDYILKGTGLPSVMRIAGGSTLNEGKGLELSERIIRRFKKYVPPFRAGKSEEPFVFDSALEKLLLKQLERIPSTLPPPPADRTPQKKAKKTIDRYVSPDKCAVSNASWDPDFWNDANEGGTVQYHNYCYNYASNRRTDTYARPGRASGNSFMDIVDVQVIRAALSDGLHREDDCFSEQELPIWYVALVIAPEYDWHWYRAIQGRGWWGHKIGPWPVKNTDNNNEIIRNPRICAQAPYTEFCGCFLVPKSQKIR